MTPDICMHIVVIVSVIRLRSKPDGCFSHSSYPMPTHTISTKKKPKSRKKDFSAHFSAHRMSPTASMPFTCALAKKNAEKIHFTAELNNKRCTSPFNPFSIPFVAGVPRKTKRSSTKVPKRQYSEKSENENTFSSLYVTYITYFVFYHEHAGPTHHTCTRYACNEVVKKIHPPHSRSNVEWERAKKKYTKFDI